MSQNQITCIDSDLATARTLHYRSYGIMVSPRIEVTVTHVGSHTVEDDTTDAGRIYREAFYNAATGIPGCERGCWGRSDKYPDKVLHFLG